MHSIVRIINLICFNYFIENELIELFLFLKYLWKPYNFIILIFQANCEDHKKRRIKDIIRIKDSSLFIYLFCVRLMNLMFYVKILKKWIITEIHTCKVPNWHRKTLFIQITPTPIPHRDSFPPPNNERRIISLGCVSKLLSQKSAARSVYSGICISAILKSDQ